MTDRVRWGAVLGAVLVVVGAPGGASAAAGSPGVGTDLASVDAGSADAGSGDAGGVATGDDGNEAPLADAGLDQEVPVNATVYLDASGSRDPDGSIESYGWSVERPDGNNIEPVCEDCARTEFQATMPGTYEVTVTVTDDDGATRSDTLYVDVYAVEGPSVELAGPTDVTADTSVSFTATAEAGDSSLARLEWVIDGTEMTDESVSGGAVTDELARRLQPGTHEVSVRVVSEMGRTDTATLTVEVSETTSERPPRPCQITVWNGARQDWNTGDCDGGDRGVPSVPADLSAGGTSDGSACLQYNQNDDNYAPNDPNHYCNNDRLVGSTSLSLTDADQDGTLQWGGYTFSDQDLQELASEVEGVTLENTGTELNFESIDAYRRAFGTTETNPQSDPTWSVSEIRTVGSRYGDGTDSGGSMPPSAVIPRDIHDPGPVIEPPTFGSVGRDDVIGGSASNNTEGSGRSGGISGSDYSESGGDSSHIPDRYGPLVD